MHVDALDTEDQFILYLRAVTYVGDSHATWQGQGVRQGYHCACPCHGLEEQLDAFA